MFSLQIVDTDAFLDMPVSSQVLYFHLAMRADDEGFVSSPKKVMRMLGSSEDDYKVLAAKKFIITFDSGICVIKHWLMHNTIRMDRFGGTTYLKEKEMLVIKGNKSYKLVDISHEIDGCQMVAKRLPQVKLSKDKLSKPKGSVGFEDFWNFYPKKVGKGAAEKSWEKLKPDLSVILVAIEQQKQSDQWKKDGGRYVPNPATWLNQKRWEDELDEAPAPDEDKEKAVDWLIEHQGRDARRVDRTRQSEALDKLVHMGVLPNETKRVLIEIESEEYWQSREEKPDFLTVVNKIQKRG